MRLWERQTSDGIRKNKWIEDREANVMQWAKNARNIIRNDKELKLIYLLRE
jgi:hypothetical protein